MRNFGPTNPHATAFPPKQWLYRKEAMGRKSAEMYCPTRCRNSTYQCGAAHYSFFMGGSIGSGMEICEISGPPISMVPRLHQSSVYIKRKLQVWRAQKCIPLVRGKNPLTRTGPQTTLFHGWQYRAENGNVQNFWPTNPHGAAFAPKQWLYQKEATGMKSSKMY